MIASSAPPMQQQQAKAEEPRQDQPGVQKEMKTQPISADLPVEDQATIDTYKAAGKLAGKKALITGGDSGIGRAVAILFAKEGADVAIAYLPKEQKDADETRKLVEQEGRACHQFAYDLGVAANCEKLVTEAVGKLGGLDLLINNASEQHVSQDFVDIDVDQIQRTFASNILNYMYVTKYALAHMKRGGKIINTASVTAYKGKKELVDYASTKGAMVAFTRSLALQVADKGIRVNAVAPGPIWTPLIPASFNEDQIKSFGANTALGRMGQPVECATAYVFLASSDSSYFTGQVLHPNGGSIVGS
ncbi:hypothetical protein AMAG_05001 [Allomyces macrogynus ATCC 38327]|uniref:Uncharacterized protein n=1 Tax=Allomyces macrogynus (strain ATCC 38327) TaxID=578462 RepID=A0A0L0S6F9_ALLM3|nr:hypothetical protein AMAG_05001 [Allomyces macrogynus ATCC 38327]|eukprot:KNE58188.1 hypothetical protein AMAG_05001 [Allomyces macrogynus ATCC 38327]